MSTKLTFNNFVFNNFSYLFKDNNCLDIGANVGDMTLIMLESGAKNIYCFEPGKNCFKILSDKFKYDSRITLYNLGLSDEKLQLNNVTWLNAWVIGDPDELQLPISPGACDIEGYERVDIELDTLDNIFKDVTEPIEFWKIDVDGYDFKVLKGGINLINRFRPIIFIELSYYYNIIPGSSVDNFLEFVKEINYKFVTLDGKIVSNEFVRQEFPYHSSCDIFYIQMKN